MKIPKTKKVSVIGEIHGIKIADPYRWLENNTLEVRKWFEQQNRHTKSVLGKISTTRKIKRRLGEVYKVGQMSVPTPRNGKYFFRYREPDQDMMALYVKEGLGGKPRLLIDPNTLSKDKTVTLSGSHSSRDGRLLLYSLSQSGNDKKDVRVLNVKYCKDLADYIPSDNYPHFICFNHEASGFWYTRSHPQAPKNEIKLHRKIYFHKLGEKYEEDKMVFGENLKKEDAAGLSLSDDGRYLLIHSYIYSEKKRRSELYLHDLENPNNGFLPIVTKLDGLFGGGIHRGNVFISTDYKAPNGKLMKISVENVLRGKGIESWQDVIPESQYVIESTFVMRDRIFVETLENVGSRLNMYDLEGKFIRDIKLPGLGSILSYGYEKEGNEIFFGFSSYNIPMTIYRFDLGINTYSKYFQFETKIDLESFVVKQEWFKSKDGTRVPIFLTHKKGVRKNGRNPTFVYGYGGFRHTTTPTFKAHVIPFIENGGIYVEVNIRGGGEFGEKWHEDGSLENKQNSFDDFIAGVEYLVGEKYTSHEKVAIFGWSNGGLLTSTVITQRPDLVKAAVIGAPVTDMLRYQFVDGGRYWINEYGVADKPEQFKYLIKYSPYHNVKPNTTYPATLIITADKDDRVHPFHSYKMIAQLQESNISQNPILLRVEKKAGHSGAAGIEKFIEQYGDIWAFVFWQLGVGM